MTMQFGGSDNDLSSFDKAKVVILPVPYGKTVTYGTGTEKGPLAILKASANLELFDDELNKENYGVGINTQPLLKVKGLKPKKMIDAVENQVANVLKKDKFPVVVGGEHTVSIGAARALKKKYKDLSVLYFDAHCDLRNIYRGSRYNHACVARRLLDIAPVVEVGARSLSREENDFASDNGIKITRMQDVIKTPGWASAIKGRLSENVYISIDLDVFDPSIMPSVGTPEPGGIGWYDFLKAIREIISAKKIVGIDVVELSPIKDLAAPDFTAAKLIYKLLGYAFS